MTCKKHYIFKSLFTIHLESVVDRIIAILSKKAKKGKKRAAAAMRGVFLLTGGGDCTII